jgi:hypothetical protein
VLNDDVRVVCVFVVVDVDVDEETKAALARVYESLAVKRAASRESLKSEFIEADCLFGRLWRPLSCVCC